jgi:hypothetical protein
MAAGGSAEDMPSPTGVLARYDGLQETPLADPAQRTEWNVRDSDRLMVLIDGAGLSASKSTQLALRCAARLGKAHVVIDLDRDDLRLCIAGPREREAPGISIG